MGVSDAETFVGDPSIVPAVIDFVTRAAEEAGLHPARLMHLQLAVEEAVVNICTYAYQVPPATVTVSTSVTAGRFIVEITDLGVPFDPCAVPEPDCTADLDHRPVGGLGILLVRRMMDEVHYRRDHDQNILTLAIALNRV
ncbi:ATP-binding protein [Methanosphaerula palustris]|uniref:Putative anti-sigma regulatory factor, serine/threonine protein kinase n=1 Tax=Methanosphaerula palustris (strain ATCC BAA-1556 / DSM 19958 / E1-9c) TaxID=521011 RepID=B8GKT7_METPE|nr:ATP-binding protein [Methanosphaerula palustris]ACL17233.1 putative anti-sigma regulatory factor, serine/threonine protein kinase [Methanosphaerula palustris E1-9c]